MADFEQVESKKGEEHSCGIITAITFFTVASEEDLSQSKFREISIKDSDIPDVEISAKDFHPESDKSKLIRQQRAIRLIKNLFLDLSIAQLPIIGVIFDS